MGEPSQASDHQGPIVPAAAARALPETPAAPHHLAPLATATILAATPRGPNTAGAMNRDQTAQIRLARANI